MKPELVAQMICSMLMDLSESIESRIYMHREHGNRAEATALEDVRDCINSTIEEARLWSE